MLTFILFHLRMNLKWTHKLTCQQLTMGQQNRLQITRLRMQVQYQNKLCNLKQRTRIFMEQLKIERISCIEQQISNEQHKNGQEKHITNFK